MTIRTAHGAARKRGQVVVVETLPADELPAGVPAPACQPATRNEQGRLGQSPGTTELARKGGLARAEGVRLAKLMGLREAPAGVRDYLRLAETWRDEQMRHLASTVGGGSVGPDVAALVSNAARAMAASLMLHDLALAADSDDAPGLLAQSSRQSEVQKGMLLAAHELSARAAKARPRDALADLDRRLGIKS